MLRMLKSRLLYVAVALVFTSSVHALQEGEGLRPLKAAEWKLERDVAGDARREHAIGLLPQLRVTLDQVLMDCNREGKRVTGVPGVSKLHSAFEWQQDDQNTKNWYPQGITGRTIGERKLLLVSWYDKTDLRGVRLSFCDVTDPTRPRYRHVLLVEPVEANLTTQLKPVKVHAGGIAWVGEFIYVVDTNNGFRVFDMRELRQVPSNELASTFDYAYVLPQTSAWKHAAGSKTAIFSSVSVDRTTSPPTLVTCEYRSSDVKGRVFRWKLDAKGRLGAGAKTTVASEAFSAAQSRLQGVASVRGEWFLSCSSQEKTRGSLYVTKAGTKSLERSWAYGPESLYVASGGYLWSLSEHPGERRVFSVKLGDYDSKK